MVDKSKLPINRVEDLENRLDKTLDYTNITNCLLENPKLVDLELNNGTLTLKAGSQVIIPYGTSAPTLAIGDSLNGGVISDISWVGNKLFYYVSKSEAIINTQAGTGTLFAYCNSTGGTTSHLEDNFVSGDTAPSSGYKIWYDTTNNIIKRVQGGVVQDSYSSLPFAKITNSSVGVTASID